MIFSFGSMKGCETSTVAAQRGVPRWE